MVLFFLQILLAAFFTAFLAAAGVFLASLMNRTEENPSGDLSSGDSTVLPGRGDFPGWPGGSPLPNSSGMEEAAGQEKRSGKESRPQWIAQVHCRGGRGTAAYRFEYRGIEDCRALYRMFGGDKVCEHACLGMGSCIGVCPAGAIGWDSDGLVWVNPDRCNGCGRCRDVCPTGVIRMIPAGADYLVACSSPESAEAVKNHCAVGCTGCKLCERKFPEAGYQVKDSLAAIDYSALGNRAGAAEVCPVKCIVPVRRPVRRSREKGRRGG